MSGRILHNKTLVTFYTLKYRRFLNSPSPDIGPLLLGFRIFLFCMRWSPSWVPAICELLKEGCFNIRWLEEISVVAHVAVTCQNRNCTTQTTYSKGRLFYDWRGHCLCGCSRRLWRIINLVCTRLTYQHGRVQGRDKQWIKTHLDEMLEKTRDATGHTIINKYYVESPIGMGMKEKTWSDNSWTQRRNIHPYNRWGKYRRGHDFVLPKGSRKFRYFHIRLG